MHTSVPTLLVYLLAATEMGSGDVKVKKVSRSQGALPPSASVWYLVPSCRTIFARLRTSGAELSTHEGICSSRLQMPYLRYNPTVEMGGEYNTGCADLSAFLL